ncbi:hypothetical protein [Ensifer canadensis]
MNFCVYLDNGAEVHGYFVPDGFSTSPKINVRINDDERITEIQTWIFIEGARAQGVHQTGNVGFILSEENIPGLSTAFRVELSDPDSGLIFYRRAQPGEFVSKKVLRIETAYVPHSEIDISLKSHFQFFEHRVERYGYETIRQMIEIIHQPSVYVSGRILLKNFQVYIDYNIDVTMISLRDPFYELALRLIVFNRISKQNFNFVPPRDKTLFRPVISWLEGLDIQNEAAVNKAIRSAPKDAMNLLSSPFTQQLTAANPSEVPTLNDVSQALDKLSQFTLFEAGGDPEIYPKNIGELLGLPPGAVPMRPQLDAVRQLADLLRRFSRIEHILEADLLLYHFVQKAGERAARAS